MDDTRGELASMVDTYTDNFVDEEKNAQDLLVDLHAAGVNTIRKRYNRRSLWNLLPSITFL